MAKIVPCYRGPNPADSQERRTAIWKWAKENAIDQGVPYEKVGEMINQHFFGGQGKSEWIADILSGRKTPYRQVADNLWRAQANRRQIIQQAQQISSRYKTPAILRPINFAMDLPRKTSTMFHSIVFPVSHAGDLALRPSTWATWWRGFKNSYQGPFDPAMHARTMANMENRALYRTAVEGGLDLKSLAHESGLISNLFGGKMSERGWDMLKVMRYELWERQMTKHLEPGMSRQQVLDLSKNIADWANHATGSTKMSLGNWGGALFGPKLTSSKLARMVADPAKTIGTLVNWKNATAGERTAAKLRLSGAAQYIGTLAGFLAANQGLLMASGSKQNINWNDPTKGDWMKFKGGGLDVGLPGMHSELRTIGQILAAAHMSSKELKGEPRQSKMNDIIGQYLMNKANPAISLGKDVVSAQDWQGRPMPWNPDPGKVTKSGLDMRRLSWPEFAAQNLPIPMLLQGPVGYFYKHLKDQGASAIDASTIMRGLMLSGLGATGLHVSEPSPSEQKRENLQISARKAQAARSLLAH